MSLPAPFGKYELLEQVGSGGMAEVFLARSFGVAGFEKRLVIKRIRPEHARDPRFVSLFINEAKIGVHLNHPNIVAVYELGKVGESYYIAMEHLHGRDVNKIARIHRAQHQGMEAGLATGIIAEVCRGLAHAHGSNDRREDRIALVHRDISPHNIFVTFAGAVKIVDFGIARLLHRASGPNRKPDQAPLRPGGGKHAYMSPEQARGETVDHRTDIFSAGIVLWELLTGAKLYQGADPEEKLRKVQRAQVPRPDEVGAAVDDDLWRILQRALARRPEDRYQSAAEFEEELRAWRYAHGTHGDASGRVALLRELFPDACESNPAALDLRRLADDLARLDPAESTRGSLSSEPTAGTATESSLSDVLNQGKEERKRVVVLVVDVDGFTAVSAHAEPEALFKRHLQFLRWLREVTGEFGGTVQRAHDDQVYIFFGVPKTRGDDLRRALSCALELQRRVSHLHERGLSVDLAIGVHTGDITAARSDSRLRYMARGDTTRLARRLSERSDHRQVLVSQSVFQSAESIFEFQRGPWLLGRGGRAALPSYMLEGRRPATATAHATPWLKRGKETQEVRRALREVAQGHGAAVVLKGKGGSGKSRLINEIVTTAKRRQIVSHVGHASPFGHALDICADLSASVLGVGDDESPAEASARVDGLRQLGLFSRDLEVLRELVYPQGRVLPSDDVWNTVRRMLQGLSENGPFVAVFEDIQHLTASDLDLLHRMILRLRDRPILFLISHQGDRSIDLPHGATLELGPFSEPLQERHLRNLLGADTIDGSLLAMVVRSCEGNPLYIEELVRYLLAEQLVEVQAGTAHFIGQGSARVPDSLAGLISARIDALDPAAKGALQLAAVMGPTFSLDLLGEVLGIDEPFPIVNHLTEHELVRRTDSSDAWSFSSEFVREAALHGILGVQRRDYHRLIAGAIERRIGQSPDQWSEALAKHCGRGGRPLDAARYAYAAGQRHEKAKNPTAALGCYLSGLKWIEQVPESEATYDARVQGETMLRLRAGAVQILVGHGQEGVRQLQLALDVAGEANLPWLEARAYLQLGRYHLHSGDLNLAGAHLGQATHMAKLEDDVNLIRDVIEARAQHAMLVGDLEEAVVGWEHAMEIVGRDKSALARCLIGLSSVHLRSEGFDVAKPLLTRALAAAREADDKILEGRVLNNIGVIHASADETDQAIRYFRSAIQVREDIGYARGVAVNHHNIGDMHFVREDLTKAYVSFSRSRDLAEEIGWTRGVAMNDVYLAYIDVVERSDDSGLLRIDEAVRLARDLGDAEIALSGVWLWGRLMTRAGRYEEAHERLVAAHAEAQELKLAQFDTLLREILEAPER